MSNEVRVRGSDDAIIRFVDRAALPFRSDALVIDANRWTRRNSTFFVSLGIVNDAGGKNSTQCVI